MNCNDLDARLHAYLSYRDAPAALAWLEHVGFEIVRRQDGEDGAVLHSEVRYGDIVLMVASADEAYRTPPLIGRSVGDGLYIWVSNRERVESWYTSAVDAGGRPVIPPEQTEWGTHRARVLDPEGKEWSIGTYAPGVAW